MSKNVFLFCVAVLLLPVMAYAGMEKVWSRNTWQGYEPFAKHEFQDDGALHIYDVQAKYGFGWRSGKHYPAKAGDQVLITASVKGKGKLTFQLQNFAADGKAWYGVDSRTDGVELKEQWQKETFRLLVSNLKKGVTGRVMPTFQGRTGDELFIKDIVIEVLPNKYAGDFMFPRHWLVFGDVDKELEAPLAMIPEQLGGVKGVSVTMNGGLIPLKSFFAKQQIRNCAWLYAELESPYDCDFTIGAGADYFMNFFVNGESIIDTMQSGNADYPPHFSNHTGTAKIKAGKNILAVKFLSGGSAEPRISLGGANELRELASVVQIIETYQQDDYEKPGQRPGNPKIVEGILTDGIETKCNFGFYQAGAEIKFGDQTWNLPPKSGGLFFATGIRLQKLAGEGTMVFNVGEGLFLELAQQSNDSNIEVVLKSDGEVLQSMPFPKSALPVDLVLALSYQEFFVNMTSIQDSRMRAINGKSDFSSLANFKTSIKLNACDATVDNYFIGLARREVKSNTIPFKVALDTEFDPVKAGWKRIWQDEFDGQEVDWENTWMNSPWNPVPRNRDMASLKDGMLHIRCDFTKTSEGKFPYKGRTVGLYSQKRFGYGYYEARVRFTKKPGWWAAFWMLDEGRNMSVGGGYELDIFEDYSTRGGAPIIANNLHATYGPNMRSYGYHFELPGSLDDFYVIGCKWTPFEFSTYVNGKLVKSSAGHSPYNSATYDAINHAFGTSTLYISISGQAGNSGGRATGEYSEEYLVDYVRAYEYPRDNDPSITFTSIPEKSVVKSGEKFSFSVDAKPSSKTNSPLLAVYLFDNGNLLDYKTSPPFDFSLALDRKHYENTAWDGAGRSGKKPVMDSYPHLFMAVVQDEAGNVAYTSPFPMIADMSGGTPYKDQIVDIPGKVVAVEFNVGGQNVASYKQERGGYETGREKLFSRKAMHLREAGEWVNYTVNAKQAGKYTVSLNRRQYRRNEWPMRGMLLVNGRYVGDLTADAGAETAVLRHVDVAAGEQVVTLMSTCAYGVWPESIEFVKE